MSKRTLISLLTVVICIVGVGGYQPLQGQAKNPLVGGIWDRTSVRTPQGLETGQGPGWFFLVFMEDGNFFITGVPKGREKLPKPAKEMTKEELVKHLDGINARRGRYTLSGNGAPYLLRITDEVNAVSANLNDVTFRVWMENGEARVVAPNGTVGRWRRVGAPTNGR